MDGKIYSSLNFRSSFARYFMLWFFYLYNIIIQTCGVSGQWRTVFWMIFFFHSRVKLEMALSTLSESDCLASASRPTSQTTWNVLTSNVPIESFTGILKRAVHIYAISRAVWMMKLFPMVLQLLSIMQHKTDVSLHLCFVCAAKVPSPSKQHFLLLCWSPMLGQKGFSNLDILKEFNLSKPLLI